MDLQLGFEDDDFVKPNPKKSDEGDLHVPYNVKICSPKWFEDLVHDIPSPNTLDPAEAEELQMHLKHSGDFNYAQKQYSKAAQQYERVLELLTDSSGSAIRQDVKENIIRCYMYSGKQEESLNLARQLVEELSVADVAKQQQSLILCASMCEISGHTEECIETLKKLCCLQPYYERFWLQLGHAYVKLGSESSGFSSLNEDCMVLALTCLMRARMLLHHSTFTASSFIKARNKDLLKQTNETIQRIPLPEEQKDYVYQFMKKDNTTEIDIQDNKEMAPELGTSCKNVGSFHERFCFWIECYQQQKQTTKGEDT